MSAETPIDMSPERSRPSDCTEVELGFHPQPAVRWLAPKVLVSTGVQSAIAAVFGSYADKRELQGSLPSTIHRHLGDELWLDYAADIGDGFDATYSVASLLAAESLTVEDAELPRGKLLVLGGDQVYPGASTRAYEDRAKGPYRAALPAARGERPVLFALPGNHDWYDGLTSFLRVFAQRRPIGGWDTEQTRSYFAVQLPQRWWLLAIDTQFDDYVDAPQLEYFREVSRDIDEGDGVILCTPSPAWVAAGSDGSTKCHDTIEFFNREIVRARGAQIRVMLSGDAHHYARFTERDGGRHLITCGLGGAYLAATHELPESLHLPPEASRVRDPSPPADYDLAARYPDVRTSRRFATGIFSLPWRNPGFWALTATFQTLMTVAVLYGLVNTLTDDDRQDFFGKVAGWVPAVTVAIVLVLGGLAFAQIQRFRQGTKPTVAGLLHAFAHIGLSVGWALLVTWLHTSVLPDSSVGDWSTLAIVSLGTPLVVGFIDAELVAVYLLLASRAGINLNEVMAGQSIEDHKGFLRLHIDRAGTLTIHPIRLDTICRSWTARPGAPAHEPWLAPTEALLPARMDTPITITRAAPGPPR
ncbi:metallophosphoesterase family protein [Actinokineospora sp. 24-640]